MRRTSVALAVFSLVALPASAQVAGLPVFNSGVNSGISLNFDYGKPNEDAGKGSAWGLTGGLALGPVGLTATYAKSSPDVGDDSNWLGATANLKLFGGPLIPVSVNGQVGLGYSQQDGAGPGGTDLKMVNIPVGIGFALNVPTPGLSIKPWIAPRMQYMRTSGGIDDSQTKFGISAGVNLGIVGGINARVAYDYLKLDGAKPSTFSFGVGYNFNIPVVPGM